MDSIVPQFCIKGVLSELLRFHGFVPSEYPTLRTKPKVSLIEHQEMKDFLEQKMALENNERKLILEHKVVLEYTLLLKIEEGEENLYLFFLSIHHS